MLVVCGVGFCGACRLLAGVQNRVAGWSSKFRARFKVGRFSNGSCTAFKQIPFRKQNWGVNQKPKSSQKKTAKQSKKNISAVKRIPIISSQTYRKAVTKIPCSS